ncbi:hypothetical protein CcaverHIS002_0307600 [Cutaneotrichosporon cavernicola]|uniref:TNFR-Cys domain-containing protein n=1 Tax=Cutaneotrichosporon cavernicola TaxID=279322 RepID=A0AA48L127_9TREE|nr:uncharacterized protein CcaverHIS019_0307510 [Cutaneotrichosporon cavernicola]BEI82892.1 hypothetical protein CcaverHIS002_0307600 [Cutaneotrichosporon cavernicola]BEI90681.1 hypothetical protein CcaverHIS019_0307510 [Cutaneotrichosporon cavernicola]BEI98459.1 hypothetical protein CcaverHIS631_0307580 [Cutaneotrichosporon cavernicola]BEJ06232.1 hypothetical protein CcaverHIS641_0307540 [Cutaneotrichosporon cavernicola]
MLFSSLCLASLAVVTATPARLVSMRLGTRGYLPQDGGCRPGDTLCDPVLADGTGGWCANLKNDPSNCGACGEMCGASFGRCTNGYCPANDPNACQKGWTGCEGGPGGYFPFTCTDLQNDVTNCGNCFIRCRDHQTCKGGECVDDANAPPIPPLLDQSCQKGFLWCDGSCRNIQNDNENCGRCRVMCADGQNCVDGTCTPKTTCPQDYCGGVGCVNKQNDNRHCGKCNNKCEPGKNCWNGVCS